MASRCRAFASEAVAAEGGASQAAAAKSAFLARAGGKALAELGDKLPATLEGVLGLRTRALKQAGLAVKQRKALLRAAEQHRVADALAAAGGGGGRAARAP